MSNFAWVTLTTNDTYSLGALVLAHSLKRAGTAHQLAVLVTPGVSESMRNKLKDVYNVVQEVNVLDSQDAANLALLARPELGITFTKLHCWRLVQFEKCVFLDSDTLVLQNCDELFEREELSAAPDVSWPDCFNSGVFVFKPSLDTFAKITEFALKHGSFDGGDQGLLNSYFADWAHTDINKHLPFIYNVTAYASYCYLPAFKQFRDKIKILHFAGKMKPWLVQFNSESRTASAPSDYAHAADLIQLWWNIFCDNVHKTLTDNMNFWRGVLEWNYFKQNYYNQANNNFNQMHFYHHNNQQHYHNSFFHQQSSDHQHIFNQQDHDAQYQYDYVKDFHDPWEDYYEQLDKQMQVQSIYEEHSNEGELHETHELHTATDETVQDHSHEQYKVEEVNPAPTELSVASTVSPQNTNWQQQTNPPTTNSTNESIYTDTSNNENSNHSTNTANNNIDLVQNLDCNSNCTVNTENIEAQSTQNENEAGLAGALSQLRLGEQRTPEQDAYEALMRRQCWEAGQIDYSGKDSFDNIWKKITETLESKPKTETETEQDDKSELLTSADIEDGKTEYDPETKATIIYKVIEGGYEVRTSTPQPNGTIKTQVRTFWDPKPVSEEDMLKEAANKKLIRQRFGKEVRIDKNTTMLTREIEGGYEEVYTTINDDGTRSMRTKTFFDSVPTDQAPPTTNKKNVQDNKKKTITRKSSVESTDSTDSRKIVQKKNQSNYQENTTVEESRRVTQNIEITENNRTVRKNSLQEQNTKSITQNTNVTDGKKKKKTKSNIPPPPPDFIENDTTTVASKRVPGGIEYTYSTQLESGKTITTSKTIYEEEEVELTEEEIREYKKTLKDAEKHKNVTTTKKLRSESGTKKIVPSENPGDVTTVETIKIEGGTEYHYTTVTAEGIVKKAVKTIFDPVPSNKNDDESEEEEIVEEYEEEIIEPGEKNIRTIETIKQLPKKFEEEVTITHEKKEKKVKKSMVISH